MDIMIYYIKQIIEIIYDFNYLIDENAPARTVFGLRWWITYFRSQQVTTGIRIQVYVSNIIYEFSSSRLNFSFSQIQGHCGFSHVPTYELQPIPILASFP